MKEPRRGTPSWVRLFRMATALYPRAFRERTGPEMERVFERELRRVREERGRVPSAAWAASTVARTVVGAAAERLHGLRRGGTMEGNGAERSEASIHGRGTMNGMKGRLEGIWHDLRSLKRQILKNPGFALVVVGTLALGIGATTTVYSVVRGVLLAPLPYQGGERIVEVVGGGASSLPNFFDLEERLGSMEVMGAFLVPSGVTLVGHGDPVEFRASQVTDRFFELLGVQPVVGRFLGPEDDQTDRAVLSHGVWTRHFGADPDVVGETVRLNTSAVEVVGVAPAPVSAPFDQDLWVPLQNPPGEGYRGSRTARAIYLFGRVRAELEPETARQEVKSEFARLQQEHPEANADWSADIRSLRETLTGDEELPLLLVLAAAVLFLAVACANVGSVLVSRLEIRRREFTVRSALGAARARLLTQAWTETLALALLGGAAGVGLAFVGVEATVAAFGDTLSRAAEIRVDGGLLLFALGVSLVTALLVGVMWTSAWRFGAPAETLQGTATSVVGRGGVVRRVLVVGQIAVALVLVTGLGLLVKSFANVQGVELGVETEDAVVARIAWLPADRYADSEARRLFLDELTRALVANPEIRAVAATDKLPLSGCCSNGPVALASDPEIEEGRAERRVVTPDFFQVVGIPLLTGRSFEARDGGGDVVPVVINRTLARTLFGEGSPLGARLVGGGGTEMEVVGVVGDVREYAPTREAPPEFYVPSTASAIGSPRLVIRTKLTPQEVERRLRAAVDDLDPLLPVSAVRPLGDLVADTVGDRRATTLLMTVLGLLSLVLGAVGVYGVTSQAVHGQIREIGLRLALGAKPESMLASTLWRSVALVLPGVALGLLGAWAAQGLVESLLFEVSTFDPWVYGAVVLAFVAVAVLAGLAPAFRAARVDPVDALREV